MRLLHPSLGLTALVAAFAVGVRVDEGTPQNTETSSTFQSANGDRETATSSQRPPLLSTRPRRSGDRDPPDPRLGDLTEALALSRSQQKEILPAIIRATYGYDPRQAYHIDRAEPARLLGPPLARADFEDALFAILDVEQQLDYAATVTEKEAWWRSVVSRLEADLENHTTPLPSLPHPPLETSPSTGRGRTLQLPPPTD